MTSSTMNLNSFSAKTGSSFALLAKERNLAICCSSRAGSPAGRSSLAFNCPTRRVYLKRSAMTWISAASILSMLSRSSRSSGGMVAFEVIGISFGARCRTRTGTPLTQLRILSPLCLPFHQAGRLRGAKVTGAFPAIKSGFLDPFVDRVGAKGMGHLDHLGGDLGDTIPILAAGHDHGAETTILGEGVAADLGVGGLALDGAQLGGDRSLGGVDDYGGGEDLGPAHQGRLHAVEHRLHDARHARHHIDVSDMKSRRLADRVVDQVRALGDVGHPEPRLVEVLRLDLFQKPFDRAGIALEFDAKGLGDTFGGDVVMGRADAAGGEDVTILGAQGVDGIDDGGLVVGHHAHFLHAHADLAEAGGDILDIDVLGAARQDFVTDHQYRRRDVFAHASPPRDGLTASRATAQRAEYRPAASDRR